MTGLRLSGLEERVVLVTGASRGIGRSISDSLAAQGAKVAATDLNPPDAPARGMGLELDVRSQQSIDEACRAVERALGPVEILVLNAGVLHTSPFAELADDIWAKVLDVNLNGAYRCAHRLVPAMAERGWGRVVAVGSSAGKTGGAVPAAAYAASKAGLMTMVRSLAMEYAACGVTANAIAPSYIATDMLRGFDDPSAVPVGRLGTPEDVAYAVAVLCSEHASYITGEILNVGGGALID